MTADRREAFFIFLILFFLLVITTIFNSPYSIADWSIQVPTPAAIP